MRSELITRLQVHLEDHDLPALDGWSYQIEVDEESWALHQVEDRYRLEQVVIDDPKCHLKVTALALDTLIKSPKQAMMMVMKKEIVVSSIPGALKLAMTLRKLL